MARKLLLVDDDEVFARTLKTSLERRQIEVSLAHSPQQGLQLARNTPSFTDVILDMNLGEQSGLAILTELRECLQDANILVLTGFASIPTTVQAIKMGADNYLAKPADTSTILRALSGEDSAPREATGQYSPMSVDRLEWEHIQRVLAEHEGNISATARALNMHRRTLQRKLAKKPQAQ